jgi:hypothetical protein
MKTFIYASLAAVTVFLCGCESPRTPMAENFGEAVKRNMAAHIINPQGLHGTEIPGHDGTRVVRAHDRLVKEKEAPTVQFPAFVVQQPGK